MPSLNHFLTAYATVFKQPLTTPGGAVKRTLAISTPSATYLHADIISDFAAMPATLSVVVYQLGAFGRGFPRAVTLEIT